MEFILNNNNRNVTDEEFLQDLRKVSAQLQIGHLTKTQHKKYGKFSPSTIEKRFGTWSNALFKAGLEKEVKKAPRNLYNINVSLEQLLEDVKFVATKLSIDSITTSQYDLYGKHGHGFVISRFGTWENALIAAGLQPTGFRHKVSKEELLEEIERIWIRLGRQPTCTDIRNGISKYSLNSYTRKFGSWRKTLEYFIENINGTERIEKPVEIDIVNGTPQTIDRQIEKSRKTSRDINLRLRFLVMKRDNFKCCMCGRSPATTLGLELQIDHIIPWSKGGETILENLQTLCRDCNLGKSNLE